MDGAAVFVHLGASRFDRPGAEADPSVGTGWPLLAAAQQCFFFILAVLLWIGAAGRSAWAEEPVKHAEQIFAVRILPLLEQKCFGCHGADAQDIKAGLDLRSREGMLRGGESGEPAIVPGKPEDSLLYRAVRWEDYQMPPKESERLTGEQIDWIRLWIEGGAPWPDAATQAKLRSNSWDAEDGIVIPTSGGLSDQWTHRRYKPEDVWAFQPLKQVHPADVIPASGFPAGLPGHPIDWFIEARLAELGLEPAPRATARELIRRVSYDLTGLPPTPEEVRAFEMDYQRDPERAWESLIDRLLNSPQYGERWAQHWLDVARYADTSGYSNDWERSNAWRYRDYVIRSLNSDKPYNQFIVEQLAGDELADLSVFIRTGSAEEVESARWSGRYTQQEAEWIVAAGFLRMGPWEHTPMNPDKVSRQAYLDDVVNSIGQTFLSLPLRCCKCHDHKFDPIPTRDYYRIYAALATTQPVERPAPFLEVENRGGFAENRVHVERMLDFAQTERDKLYEKREAAARKWYEERGRAGEYVPFEQRLRLPEGDKPPRFIGLTTEEQGILKVREQDVRIWNRCLERFEPLAQSVYNGGDLFQNSVRLRLPDPNNKQQMAKARQMPATAIYLGGNLFTPGDAVSPGVLSSLGVVPRRVVLPWEAARPGAWVGYSSSGASYDGGLWDLVEPFWWPNEDGADPHALVETMGGRRLSLALWIADPRNPLTARSIVNRVWHYHFGQGIVATPNNFGAGGKRPTHPELLDWMAREFIDHGWSLKWLHRLIMTSEAYRRSCQHPDPKSLEEKDPNRQWYAVFRPRRLTAEELRDSMLAVSGELNLEMGGLPICPEINMEVALSPRMLQFSLAPAWQPSRTPSERNRRSVYTYRVRGLADPLLEVFNQPNPNDSCECRDTPSVTPQVFTLMHSDYVTKRTVAMALRLERESSNAEQQLARAYELTTGTAIDPQLLELLKTHYEQAIAYHREHPATPVVYPTKVVRALVEELSGDPFEYDEWLEVYERYVPDRHPSDVSPETRALADVCLLLINANGFIYVY